MYYVKGGKGMGIELTGDVEALERDLKRVIDKLPKICTDTMALLFIMQTLLDSYKEATGKELKI